MTVKIESPFFAPRNVVTYVDNGCVPNITKFRNDGWSDYHNHRPNFITDDDVFLSGYVDREANVTYESHDFWVRFIPFGRRFDAMITVHNGAGTQVLTVEYHVAMALKALFDAGQMVPAFHMCWGLFHLARSAREIGQSEKQKSIYEAFVGGRLKKRKKPNSGAYKVWIEDKGGLE